MVNLGTVKGFEWDTGNIDKSYVKHGITPNEAETVFTDEKVGIEKDVNHQELKERYIAIGKTFEDKILFVIFTLRKTKMRIISARPANKKERRIYEKSKKIPKFSSEKAERDFWQRVDSTEYVDYKNLEHWSSPNLKLTTKPITIRLPAGLIDRLKIRAHKMDVPYQALIKQLIFNGLNK